MTIMRRGMIAAMVTASMAGGAIGATVLNAASSSAATTTTTTSSSTPSPGGYGAAPQSGGVFHSNENATHEKSESAQREAQETAGQFPTVP
jgi:ABC-type glycerol-3-phosphate transport system substrate-binding protein